MYQNCYVDSYNRKAYIWDDQLGLQVTKFNKYCYVKDEHGDHTTMFGDKCRKVYSWKDYKPSNLFESDVNSTTRVLVDVYSDDDTPSTNHTVLTYDIEVDSTGGFPEPEHAANTVTSIACYDDTSCEYKVFILDEYSRLTETKTDNRHVIPFDNEINLLMAFIDHWEVVAPTIVTGWNTKYFDNPYIIKRIIDQLGVKNANRLSPIGIVQFMEHLGEWRIAGVSSLDYLQLYKKFNYSEESSYSLNAISKKELGRGKIEYDGDLDSLLRDDPEKFIDYNVTDVDLVVALDQKLQFIDLARGIAHAGRVTYEDFIFSSKYLEGAILTYLKQRDLVACNKPDRTKIQDKGGKTGFDGAYVKVPQGGVYEWVYDLDLTSLYPSIIMSLNISPETKLGKIASWDANAFFKDQRTTWVVDGDVTSHDDLKKFIIDNKIAISSNGIMYRTDVVGCIPDILNTWFNKRVEYKNLMKKYGKAGDDEKYRFYHKRQLVQKILLNSLYGVLGLPVFRFYDLDNALAVTSVGQEVIKNTAKVVNLKYNKELGGDKDHNIYIDTDSVFYTSIPLLEHRHDTSEWDDSKWAIETDKLASEMQNHLNKFYDVFARRKYNIKNHRFEIKKEYVARRALWLQAKKRYAQWIIMDNGVPVNKLDVKGMDVVRSTFPPAFKRVMTDVLNGIVLEAKKQDDIDDIVVDFKKIMQELNPLEIARSSSVKDITSYIVKSTESDGLDTYIKGTPVHVKSAIAFNNLLKYYKCSYDYPPISNGDKIKWVYLKNNPLQLDQLGFRGENDPDIILQYIRDYIDTSKIYERELDNKLGSIYEAMRWVQPTMASARTKKFFKF
jgi:DNA polymerase elongation subunit (family B)